MAKFKTSPGIFWCRWMGAWWCWQGCSWTGGGSQVFGRVELCCICWPWRGGCRVSYMEPVAIMGFLPPINRSWLRAVFIRPEDRNPAFTLSKLVSVWDLAKLTCFVLDRGICERLDFWRGLSGEDLPHISALLLVVVLVVSGWHRGVSGAVIRAVE